MLSIVLITQDAAHLLKRTTRFSKSKDRQLCFSRHTFSAIVSRMTLDDYKTVLYRQEDGSWVAEIPAISGCYALMPSREEALSELKHVFEMVAEEYREQGQALPEDSTEIVNA